MDDLYSNLEALITHRDLTRPLPSLRGHIVNVHLTPVGLEMLGIPIYDLNVLAYRARIGEMELSGAPVNADWVVKKIYQKLEHTETEIKNELPMYQHSFDGSLSSLALQCLMELEIFNYRKNLVKTLKYIEQLGLAYVDWARIKNNYQ